MPKWMRTRALVVPWCGLLGEGLGLGLGLGHRAGAGAGASGALVGGWGPRVRVWAHDGQLRLRLGLGLGLGLGGPMMDSFASHDGSILRRGHQGAGGHRGAGIRGECGRPRLPIHHGGSLGEHVDDRSSPRQQRTGPVDTLSVLP